jgi:hypothetical protein
MCVDVGSDIDVNVGCDDSGVRERGEEREER